MTKFYLLLLALTVGCASGNCRSHREEEAKKAAEEAKAKASKSAAAGTPSGTASGGGPAIGSKTPDSGGSLMNNTVQPKDRVRVYKNDGSLQCGMGSSISLDDMQKDLKSVKVYSSSNKPDGLMHIQMCGSPTGRCNIYEIDRSNLEAAKKLGFSEWTYE